MLDIEALSQVKLRPLKRAEYDRLVEMGAFEDERVELLYGMLVTMSPQNSPHAWLIQRLTKTFAPLLLADRADVRVQLPFIAADDSEPEPDLALVPVGDYRNHHPSKAFLLIEVADSSVGKDREIKARLYAESGVPEYWLFDVQARSTEVFRKPEAGRYATVSVHGPNEKLRPLAFDDLVIDPATLWG